MKPNPTSQHILVRPYSAGTILVILAFIAVVVVVLVLVFRDDGKPTKTFSSAADNVARMRGYSGMDDELTQDAWDTLSEEEKRTWR